MAHKLMISGCVLVIMLVIGLTYNIEHVQINSDVQENDIHTSNTQVPDWLIYSGISIGELGDTVIYFGYNSTDLSDIKFTTLGTSTKIIIEQDYCLISTKDKLLDVTLTYKGEVFNYKYNVQSSDIVRPSGHWKAEPVYTMSNWTTKWYNTTSQIYCNYSASGGTHILTNYAGVVEGVTLYDRVLGYRWDDVPANKKGLLRLGMQNIDTIYNWTTFCNFTIAHWSYFSYDFTDISPRQFWCQTTSGDWNPGKGADGGWIPTNQWSYCARTYYTNITLTQFNDIEFDLYLGSGMGYSTGDGFQTDCVSLRAGVSVINTTFTYTWIEGADIKGAIRDLIHADNWIEGLSIIWTYMLDNPGIIASIIAIVGTPTTILMKYKSWKVKSLKQRNSISYRLARLTDESRKILRRSLK